MSVWKKQSVKWFKGEKRSKKGVSGAEPRTLYSKRLYGTLKTYDNKKKQAPLAEDEDTFEALLKALQRTEDERRLPLWICRYMRQRSSSRVGRNFKWVCINRNEVVNFSVV